MTQAKLESSKFTTFIATLRLTSSDNDGEALAAIRAANRLLAQFGGDWDALLRGRVTLIADPFTSVPEVAQTTANRPAPPPPQHFRPAPPRPKTPTRPYSPPPPTPQQRAKQWRKPRGRKPNLNDLQF